jgi:hypothetical protein
MQPDTKEPTLIYVEYGNSTAIDIDVICEEYGIEKEDIECFDIKWNSLYLQMTNGNTIEVCIDEYLDAFRDGVAWKRPTLVHFIGQQETDLRDEDNPFTHN